MGSLYLVKWFENTKMVVFIFLVGVKGSTKSINSTCEGLPANRSCLCPLLVVALCLENLHSLQECSNHVMSAALSGHS